MPVTFQFWFRNEFCFKHINLHIQELRPKYSKHNTHARWEWVSLTYFYITYIISLAPMAGVDGTIWSLKSLPTQTILWFHKLIQNMSANRSSLVQNVRYVTAVKRRPCWWSHLQNFQPGLYGGVQIYRSLPFMQAIIPVHVLFLAPSLHSCKANLLQLHFLCTLMETILPHHCQYTKKQIHT